MKTVKTGLPVLNIIFLGLPSYAKLLFGLVSILSLGVQYHG